MNRLQHETSPYLLQHAHNPVDWYPWGEEAFEKARREDKPIIVSIGYSTCHWCHVMERESFEDKDTADFMNEHFVSIKVDREERPDVDQIYMEVCQVLTGSGGWPLNCFLLPDARPFYAGTYYPPFPAYNRPSWLQVLQYMHKAYRDQQEDVQAQAQQLLDTVEKGGQVFVKNEWLDQEDEAVFTATAGQQLKQAFVSRFDREEGGFGGAPKFPGSMGLSFLLDYHHFTDDKEAIDHVHLSLEKMIKGGIYDQLGGGFARYATDRAWLVPHFEKMLYDNALIVSLMADAYRIDQRPLYREAIRETLAFVEREMTSPEGVFYSALDADSEGEEGKFYVFQQAEVEALLGEDTRLFSRVYGTSETGNWEGTNILSRVESVEEAAAALAIDPDEAHQRIAQAKTTLFNYRAERVRPGLDDKTLLSWNAMMITAYTKAYQALGDPAYRKTAVQALETLIRQLAQEDGSLLHTVKEGKAQYAAFLDDYADLISALLDVYAITHNTDYIDKAQTFTDYVLEHFLDKADNLFYFTSAQQHDIPVRRKEMYDNAVPAGNSTMALNLQRLAVLTGKQEWDQLSLRMLKPMVASVQRYPTSFSRWAKAVLYRIFPAREVAIVGPQAMDLAQQFSEQFYPNTLVMASAEGGLDQYPLMAGRKAGHKTQIFVCRQYSCQMPVSTLGEAKALL